MAVTSTNINQAFSFTSDPLLPWLHSIKKGLDDLFADHSEENSLAVDKLVSDCIRTFKNNPRYQNDVRFLKVWFLYMDCCRDFHNVFKEIEELQICLGNSVLYETCAVFLEAKGQLIDAHEIYRLGISRNAEPIERLKKAHKLFLERISVVHKACSIHQNVHKDTKKLGQTCINPWSSSTIDEVLQKILPHLVKYEGYHFSSKNFPGKVALSTLQKSSRNKKIKIGGREYLIKGCAGHGGFAQVFKACIDSDPDEIIALKIQAPPFPWEFYMYRQLDQRLPTEKRSRFGNAQRMHHYSDYSILVCDYLSHGTLHDAINSYIVVGAFMEEVLCMYYTIEMLHMLETLHSSGIIHGDFKPDNLLIRNSRVDLTEDMEHFVRRRGPWQDQGLCLVDWGRGIDLKLFSADTMFHGDCRTSGFCCVEMREDKPWKFQVDTYGLCVIVHMMLHNKYMDIEKNVSADGGCFFLPKLPFKRYWNIKLWDNLFKRLLNVQSCDDHLKMLRELRESFQEYVLSDPSFVKKLKESLRKQRLSLCSA
ncbi:mitotic checkpoint serine/threonine-protein kinase BUB1-like [Chenopodium quinoa]|uniref:mitotic checkpoint serine/threonine-protein kinase BUB1-like n=1 Tax=Chenopodium quinoa TaxID=63459 RepID=UPI000B773C7C|nr:mitotic checkpoint serine/threonine-protein kinase BUB1-like [Chenopodium quinoa]